MELAREAAVEFQAQPAYTAAVHKILADRTCA